MIYRGGRIGTRNEQGVSARDGRVPHAGGQRRRGRGGGGLRSRGRSRRRARDTDRPAPPLALPRPARARPQHTRRHAAPHAGGRIGYRSTVSRNRSSSRSVKIDLGAVRRSVRGECGRPIRLRFRDVYIKLAKWSPYGVIDVDCDIELRYRVRDFVLNSIGNDIIK